MQGLKKCVRLFHTLRYVKPIQVYFQVWYRVKKIFLTIHKYKKYKDHSICLVESISHEHLVLSKKKYISKNNFEFLNLQHRFNDTIDWRFMDHGKLWNYSLQYFDYLLDDSISLEERIALIDDFSTQLLAGKIELEPYPVSLRIINTLIFISVNNLSNDNIAYALKLQINYLEHNLEYHLLANHLLENIIALYIASFSIADAGLFKKSERLLHKELEKQILPDGAHYECSVMYHSIITSKLLLCIDIARLNAPEANIDLLRSKAALMMGWLNAYSFPDGTWALFNDTAADIAPATPVLNTVAAFLNVMPYPVKMKESGYRKIKNGNAEMVIKAGNILPAYQPGHTHADMLSFCWWADGRQCIVDMSVSTYNNDQQRHFERSTKAHNTVSLRDMNQSDVWSSFRIGKRASCKIIHDQENELIAEHNGYSALSSTHQRKFSVVDDGILVEDLLSGQAENAVSALHFDHSVQPVLSNDVVTSMNVTVQFKCGYTEKKLIRYMQPVGFNRMQSAYKFVASVDHRSSFLIRATES